MPERVCSSSDSLRTLLSDKSSPLVVNFTASWAPQCAHITDVLKTLSDDPANSDVRFVTVDAEVVSELSKEMGISVVPTVIIMQNGAEVHRVCGAKIAELTQLITGLHKGWSNAVTKPSATNAGTDLNTRLSSASQPRCGFSRQILELLNSYNVTFDTFDILLDEEVRKGESS
ncbi:Glutaredoxin [Paragonimus heterotremus]|uniref:Glutaredoxin n=1 Tax=Paragonimus heterotremus TaxID=100268 RepID=A0A8J4SN49_9TREM|nr:Glutaredoxin [Paragonimus heterotremus]